VIAPSSALPQRRGLLLQRKIAVLDRLRHKAPQHRPSPRSTRLARFPPCGGDHGGPADRVDRMRPTW
jgi:hypothetical protein